MTQQQQALEKLEQLVKDKKVYKNSLAYKSALCAIMHPSIPVVCGKNTGNGRHSSSKSWLTDTRIILTKIGVYNAEYTNDAPNGGKHGDKIIVYLD